MSLTVAIMAGGGSRRMGRDKAELSVGGMPMLGRVAGAALATGLPVMVVGRERGEGIGGPLFIRDDAPGNGPIGGIATALRHAGGPVLAIACDMPLLTTEALLWLAATAIDAGDHDGVVAVNDGRPEPLFALYDMSALPLIDALLARGDRALRSLVAAGRFLHRDVPSAIAGTLRNINTPGDLAGLGEPGMHS